MKRTALVGGVLKYVIAQQRSLLSVLFSLARSDFETQLQNSLSNYLDSASRRFDQSSSNFRLSDTTGIGQRSLLVAELCNKLAAVYGAPYARVNLSGSSASIRQVLGHVIPRARPGKPVVLLDPACHKSAFGGLIESGLDVVYLRRTFSAKHGIFGPIDIAHLNARLTELGDCTAAVFITNPTYEGFDSRLDEIRELCTQHNTLLCVDAAWGSNYGLVQGWPNCAIADADIVITSPHKKSGAPSQAGVVLFRSPNLARLYDDADQVGYASTSPNWNLLILLERRVSTIIAGEWDTLWRRAKAEAEVFRQLLSAIHPALINVSPQCAGSLSGDPTHVYINTTGTDIHASEWANVLSRDHQIDIEMAGPNGLLLLFGPGHEGLSSQLAGKMKQAFSQAASVTNPDNWTPANTALYRPPTKINPRAAYFSETASLPFDQTRGQISASLVFAYPPGIPIIAYGETITSAHIEAVNQLKSRGVGLVGLSPENQIKVTRAPPTGKQSIPSTTQTADRAKNMTLSAPPGFNIEGYAFGSAPDDVITEVADLFREVFCNSPYNQYAALPAEPTKPLSFADLAPEGYSATCKYQPLEILDRAQLPSSAFRWMDPVEFVKRFRAKSAELYVSTARSSHSKRLKAFSVGRILTVRQLFYTEEIRNPIYYSSREFIETLRRPSEFFDLMKLHFDLSPEDKLFFALGYGAHPSLRGTPYLAPMMAALAENVLPEHASLPAMAEIPNDGAGRVYSQAVHERVVYGVLGNDHAVVFARQLKTVMAHYLKGQKHLTSTIKSQIRVNKRGLNPHDSDHSAAEIRATPDKGYGVFATRAIKSGELIAEFIGDTYVADRESDLPSVMIDRCIQVGKTQYVFAENRLAEKLNHSCDPNCGIREKTKIVAIKPIAEGDEICWDYRMSENSDWVLEHCNCGSTRCAKRVEGYDSLPPDIRTEYLAKGAISTWLLD